MRIDTNIKDAIDNWIKYGLQPGSCTELLLRGQYDEAFRHAHPLIKPHWQDYIKYVESLPIECRGENFDKWRESFSGNRKDGSSYQKVGSFFEEIANLLMRVFQQDQFALLVLSEKKYKIGCVSNMPKDVLIDTLRHTIDNLEQVDETADTIGNA